MKTKILSAIFILLAVMAYCQRLEKDVAQIEVAPREFISSINLESKKYQLLISSQNYGTNYAIYIKPTKIERDKETGGILLKQAEFKLVNYKAKLFLGIKKVVVQKVCSPHSDIAGHKFKIYVQGHMKYDNFSYQFTARKKLVFKKNEVLISERYLVPMFAVQVDTSDTFERGDMIKAEETDFWIFCDYQEDLGILKIKPHNDYVVDNEYFHIDGIIHIVKKRNYDENPIEQYLCPEQKEKLNVKRKAMEQLKEKLKLLDFQTDLLIPGPRCKTGFSIIM